MQVKRTNTSDTEIKLTIVASPEELQSMKQHVLGHFRNKVKIAGFREGKAPLELVEKNIEASVFQSEYLEEIINTMYGQAIRDEKLRPVSTPEVNVTKFVPYTTLEFDATLSIIGDVVLPDYKKFRLAKKAVKITAADVTDVIKNLQNRAADKKDVTRAAKLTDQVTIDFLGKNEKGEAIAGADGKDYPLTLGSNTFIPGFEPEVVGMKAGEEKTFDVTFPADYHAKDLASKKVSFTVNATKVQELVEPKADDAFAATVGPFTTIEELKTDIKKQLEVERQAEADKAYENELVGALAEQTSVALPPAIVEEQIDKIEDQERQNLVYRGQTWEEHLKEEGVTAEEHREQKRAEAQRSIRASLLLADVADAEKLDVTPEELQARIAELKARYNDAAMQEELSKPENQRDIASRILTEKAVAKLIGYATAK